jgi:hypothetical protein
MGNDAPPGVTGLRPARRRKAGGGHRRGGNNGDHGLILGATSLPGQLIFRSFRGRFRPRRPARYGPGTQPAMGPAPGLHWPLSDVWPDPARPCRAAARWRLEWVTNPRLTVAVEIL